MTLRLSLALSLAALAGINSGCEVGDPSGDQLDSPRAARRTPQKQTSIGWGCRGCGFSNSPLLGTFPLDTIYTGSLEDPDLNRLVSATSPAGDVFAVSVDHDMLVATGNGSSATGHDLVGWTLQIKTGGQLLNLEIYNFAEVEDWTDQQHDTPTWGLAYYDATSDSHVNVCPGLNLDETSVVLLNEETYDADHEVYPGKTGFTTLACRGHALAKMKLLGYGPDDVQFSTSPEERQATLRMLTADYCGDGSSNTVVGQSLGWADAREHVLFDPSIMTDEIEAEWDDSGATCVNTPRAFPRAQVVTCGLPYCEDTYAGNNGATWATLNP